MSSSAELEGEAREALLLMVASVAAVGEVRAARVAAKAEPTHVAATAEESLEYLVRVHRVRWRR